MLLAGQVAVAAFCAFELAPAPHSDWLLYWLTAGDAARYERGGIGLWLFALPKAAGLSPALSALCINLPAGLAIAWLAWRADRTRWHLAAVLVAAYLLMLAPYAAIVQLDLVAAAFIAAGWSLLLKPPANLGKGALAAGAVACLAAGVSTKPQYALVFWMLLCLLFLPALAWRRRREAAVPLLAIVFVGSLVGFALDNGLRAWSGQTDRLRTSQAVTLYGGLLVSPTEGGMCGYWSEAAAAAASADKALPLAEAIGRRLAAHPPAHWLGVLRCKWPKVLQPPAFALYWLVESPNVRVRMEASPDRAGWDRRYRTALDREGAAYAKLRVAMLLAVPVLALMAWRRGGRVLALLPVAWIVGFWAVHLAFEIQGRYFLGLFLLAPLVAALAYDAARRGAVEFPTSPASPELPR